MISNTVMIFFMLIAVIYADNIYIEPRQPDLTDPLVKQDFFTNIHLQDYPSLTQNHGDRRLLKNE